MAISEDGMSFGTSLYCSHLPVHWILGMNSMVSIEHIMMRTMNHVSGSSPERQTLSLPWPIWNGCSCESPITIAMPQQKPSMMEAAISVMKRSPRSSHTSSMKAPATITDGKSSRIPSPLPPSVSGTSTNVAMMAAYAPSAPLTMPERPPKMVQMRPTTHAACSATGGLMCAMKAKATDSGTCAKQIVMPSSTSVFTNENF
mmetsp:Transcript_5635/g.14921  ORF Transcript_5635/g.14921 Transcript_5635/m.14921 type:complete len:201 (-) Transcript_5635:184-786(-)